MRRLSACAPLTDYSRFTVRRLSPPLAASPCHAFHMPRASITACSPCHAFGNCDAVPYARLYYLACTSSYTVLFSNGDISLIEEVRTCRTVPFQCPHSHTQVRDILNCTHPQQHGDSHELNPPSSGCCERTFTGLLEQDTTV